MSDITKLSLIETLTELKAKKFSVSELVNQYIKNIKGLDIPSLRGNSKPELVQKMLSINQPNTFFKRSVPLASGSFLIFFSSSATCRKSACNARSVT